jgi:hypothetical protein
MTHRLHTTAAYVGQTYAQFEQFTTDIESWDHSDVLMHAMQIMSEA